jgi:hypothetical protein
LLEQWITADLAPAGLTGGCLCAACCTVADGGRARGRRTEIASPCLDALGGFNGNGGLSAVEIAVA